MYLFQNQTTNGDSIIFGSSTRDDVGLTEDYVVYIFGTWDGCSVTIHYSFDNINYSATDTDATFTQNGGVGIKLPIDSYIKATLTGAGVSTDITAILKDRQNR